MRVFIVIAVLLQAAVSLANQDCPNHKAFMENGWLIHGNGEFDQILAQRLAELLPEAGRDLILDQAEFCMSCYCYDDYLIMQIVIYDRLSTCRDEM